MKKIITILFVLVLMCSSLASAGFLRDSFNFITTGNLITGDTVAEEANVLEGEEPAPSPEPAPVTEPEPIIIEPTVPNPEPTPVTEPILIPGTEPTPIAPIVPGTDQPVNQPIYNYPQPSQEPQCWKDDQQVPCDQVNNQPSQPSQNYLNGGDYKKQLYGDGWCENGNCCPDGICDDYEKSSKGCPQDCGWSQNIQNSNQQPTQTTQNQQQTNYMSGGCMDSSTLEIAQQKCGMGGGVAEVVDVSGCQKINCKMSGSYGGGLTSSEGMNQENMDSTKQKCESMGLTADVKPTLDGYQVECVQNGYQQIGYIDKEIDATEALEFVFKLEEIKMKLDENGDLYNRVNKLKDYCNSKGTDDCSRYENAQAMMTEASSGIDSLMSQMKTSIEEKGKLTVEDLYMFKAMTNEIINQNLMKVAYALIGVNIETLTTEEIIAEDCGTDGDCFEEKFRVCAVGSSTVPEEGVILRITSLEEGTCRIEVEINGEVLNCNFNEGQYKYMPLSKETFNAACGVGFTQYLNLNPEQTLQATPEIVGGVGGKEVYCQITDTCDCDELCEEDSGEDQWCDDCMRFGVCGDGLCEPKVGEDSNNCAADCMGNSEEIVLNPIETTPIEEVVEEIPIEETIPTEMVV